MRGVCKHGILPRHTVRSTQRNIAQAPISQSVNQSIKHFNNIWKYLARASLLPESRIALAQAGYFQHKGESATLSLKFTEPLQLHCAILARTHYKELPKRYCRNFKWDDYMGNFKATVLSLFATQSNVPTMVFGYTRVFKETYSVYSPYLRSVIRGSFGKK